MKGKHAYSDHELELFVKWFQYMSTVNSSHNWNSLFLNQNAILDSLASKFKADKANILDSVSFANPFATVYFRLDCLLSV